MIKHTKTAIISIMVGSSLLIGGHRILVNLLADKGRKRMVTLGYRCSTIYVEPPQRLVDPA